MTAGRIRLDKWLWHARFCKTRGRAAGLCESGLLRVNGQTVLKPAHLVKPGDRLVVPRGAVLLTVEILGLGSRRGPYSEAATLYHEPDPSLREPLSSADWNPLLDDDLAV